MRQKKYVFLSFLLRFQGISINININKSSQVVNNTTTKVHK